jgi:carboxyl-terminal processing protease
MRFEEILVITLLGIGLSTNQVLAKSNDKTQKVTTSSVEIQRLNNVVKLIHEYYVEPISDEKLYESAIEGMLSKLDPHSSYLSAEDLKSLDIAISGKFEGIGVTVVPDHGALKIISPIDGSPAQKAGIKAGDLVIRINDKLVMDVVDPDKAVEMMRGRRGTKVTLYVIRKNEEKPLKFTITRNVINIQAITSKLLNKNYGYVRIAIFYKSTESDLQKAIQNLQKKSNKKLRGLILDLRNNPGGLFNPAIEVADDFLDAEKLGDNSLIVSIKGYPDSEPEEFSATKGELLPGIPVVVLINEGSASAAEIIAGALQDQKRAVIVGTKSFGKGSVQTVIPIDNSSAIKLTTALYYTPLGRCIQAKGIAPDVVVSELKISQANDDEGPLGSIYEHDLDNHIVNDVGQKSEALSEEREMELLRKDFQLYEALMILKGVATDK